MRYTFLEKFLKFEKIILAFSYIFYFLFFLYFLRDLVIPIYDKDLDTEIYFGSRLIEGELLFVKEYTDKLPIVQYLFAIPAYFKNYRFFTLINGFLALFSSYFFSKLTYIYLEKSNFIKGEILANICKFSGSLFLFLTAIVYGSLNHISSISSILTLLLFSIYIYSSSKFNLNNNFLNIFLFTLSALVISIRPYFFAPISILPIWHFVINQNNFDINLYKNNFQKIKILILYLIKWNSKILFFTFLINSFPYFYKGQFEYFLNGLRHNGQELLPRTTFDVFINIVSSFSNFTASSIILFSLFLLLPLIYSLFNIKNIKKQKKVEQINLLFFSCIFPFSLLFLISTKHFHYHYFQYFLPFVSLSAPYIILILYPVFHKLFSLVKIRNYSYLFLISFFLILITPDTFNVFTDLLKHPINHPSSFYVNNIKKFLKESTNKKDFLFPNNSFVHWKLRESRHGFPHPSNINHINNGYWNNINKYSSINTPKNASELCQMYQDFGPTIIVLDDKDTTYSCLNKVKSNYLLVKATKLSGKTWLYNSEDSAKLFIKNQKIFDEIYFFKRKE